MPNVNMLETGSRAGRAGPDARLTTAALLRIMLVMPTCLLLAAPAAAAQTKPAPAPAQTNPPQPKPPEPAPKSEQKPAPARPKGETPATVLDDKEVDGILGKEIRGAGGESMGRIVDVLVNRNGQVRAAIIDFGGFLGVGSRKIAVDWHAIHFAPDGKLDRIVVSLTRDEVRLAPEYKRGEPIVVLGPSSTAQPPATKAPPTGAPKPAGK